MLLTFLFHSEVSDEYRPHIGTSLGNHQHPNHGNGVRPQHHWDVKSEAQHDGQPHPAEHFILVILCTAIEQYNHQKPQQGERDVAVNAPRERVFRTKPLVLGHHA